MPVHVTIVKKRLLDGTECRKCRDATAYLESRGLWSRIDEIVWAQEGDSASPGLQLATRLGVEQAPFFVVNDGGREVVYVSVMQLARERFGTDVTATEKAASIDIDDIGGI